MSSLSPIFNLFESVEDLISGKSLREIVALTKPIHVSSDKNEIVFQTENCGAEEVQNLRSLVANLRQLCDLYTKYNCHLSLSDYERVSIKFRSSYISVAIKVLDT